MSGYGLNPVRSHFTKGSRKAMTRTEIEIFEREIRRAENDLRAANLKPKPAEIPAKTNFKNLQMEPITMKKETSLTWKSVVALVVVAIAQAILSLWFDEQTTTKLIEVIKAVLEALGFVAVAGAAWGIRRAI